MILNGSISSSYLVSSPFDAKCWEALVFPVQIQEVDNLLTPAHDFILSHISQIWKSLGSGPPRAGQVSTPKPTISFWPPR